MTKVRCLELLGTVLLLFLVTSLAEASPPRSQSADWDGLADLVRAGREVGVPLDFPSQANAAALGAHQALLVIQPQQPLPRRALSRFLHLGGRVAVLDDHGQGAAVLAAFGISEQEYRMDTEVPTLRNNPRLPIAVPAATHPLSEGIRGLATNHPQVLHHAELEPIFTFGGDPQRALVMSGAVGTGRLIAVADESLIINAMLSQPDNHRFAVNLLRYLVDGGAREVVVLVDEAQLHADGLTQGGDGAVAKLRATIADFAQRAPSDRAVRVGAWALALGLLFAAMSALPRGKAYGRIHRARKDQR